jgi:N-acetylglucosaminyldiphosphoundecaprenol N-acetyl-beta-D-mannosaminyltransferase
MSLSRVFLLGVPLDPVTREEAVVRLLDMLAGDTQHHVMTPNNEMLVTAHSHAAFRAVLRSTALNLPDSTGLLLAARLTGQQLPERVTGADTVAALCARLPAQHSVFLLGAQPGVAEKAAAALQDHSPKLVIAGTYAGSPAPHEVEAIIQKINASDARLLLVAYGAPSQDLWIAQYMHRLPAVRVAIGVGGTFDFLAGTAKRAPRWMRKAGLEWCWRFVQQPSRWKRMWNAVIVFPLLVLRYGKGITDQ